MFLNNYNILNGILRELHQEIAVLDEEIQYNSRYIRESENYVKSFTKYETDDIKVFSPRRVEVKHGDELKRFHDEASFYEEKNKELNHKRDILYSRINRLETILKREKSDITVLEIQERDRQRIARDLHDTSLQNLTYLIHQIELSSLYIDKDPVRAKLELSVVSKKLGKVINEIRNTIFDLRPMTFDDLGLKDAFERLIDSVNENGKYELDLDIENVSCETNLILVTLYRVVQESLNNIVKHAAATKIIFHCKCLDEICRIYIEDNGKGFEESVEDKKHFGIAGMRERVELLGGEIEINSIPGSGTSVKIEVPLY